MTPPPVEHPGLVGQPLFGEDTSSSDSSSGAPAGRAAPAPAPRPGTGPIDPATLGVIVKGTALQTAVAKVLELDWLASLDEAKAQATATGRPIFWLQGLGNLNGYACSALQSLRGLTLPDEKVRALLAEQFVLGYRDIETAAHVGLSDGYRPYHSAVASTNGAGGRNLQILVLAGDGTVVHALPGYWDARDLVAELEFAQRLHRLYRDDTRPRRKKVALYEAMHRAFTKRISPQTRARSRWQQPDARREAERAAKARRDTLVPYKRGRPIPIGGGLYAMKPLCDLVHERMIARPFRPLDSFGMEGFVDYGQPRHDQNAPHDTGRKFRRAMRVNKKREEARRASERR